MTKTLRPVERLSRVIELDASIRHVRTAAGVEFFKKPIGTPITKAEYSARRAELISAMRDSRKKYDTGHVLRVKSERDVRSFDKEFGSPAVDPNTEASSEELYDTNFGSLKYTREEAKAEREITGQYFHGVNDALRKGEGGRSGGYVDVLSKAIARSTPSDRRGVLHRGVRNRSHPFGEIGSTVGRVVTEPAFMSTTADESVARHFLGRDGIHLRLHVPVGAHALRTKSNNSEQELLFAPGAKLRIHSDYLDPSGARIVDASYDGQDPEYSKIDLSQLRDQLIVRGLILELSKKTAALERTPAPIGKPGGPGLWHVKGMEMPPYFQNVRNALIRNGHSVAGASAITWGAMKRWATGGGNVHPEVRKAAVETLGKLKVKEGIAHAQRASKGGH